MKRLIAFAPLALAGCAVGPQHPTTTPSLAPATASERIAPISGPAQDIVAGASPKADWWTAFGSAKLDALVDLALAKNEDLALAETTLRQARETAGATAGAALPQADVNYNVEHARVSNALATPLVDPNETLYTLHTAQLSVTYPLDLFGLQRNRSRSARAQAEVASERLRAARKTVVANLVTAVIQFAALGGQIDATNAAVASNRDLLAMLLKRQALGDIGNADIAAQQAALATAESSLPPLVRQGEHQRTVIAALLGIAPGSTLPPLPAFAELSLPATLPVALPAAIVANRPDIRAADAQMRGAGADLGAAIAARLPNLVLSGQAGGASPNFADMFASGNPFWTLIGGITQPIFHGGTLRHQQRAAAAALDGAKAQYRSAVLQAFADVSDALTGLRTDADVLDAATRAGKAADLSLIYGRRQLALGGIGTLTLLNASAADAQATAALIQAQAARLTDTVALYQAVGGGIDATPAASGAR
ncbi:efflux transporter outer membrane subunit [Sphingomonas bacterium]|uniref:efflux transporter outer membrane subunit n=1 Tax=Sphingomonas bacterium TaxID=1895847 RepID=UPI001576C88A|nr:efflux transporter outer membrane subunit [Sphingomonas bacterium]